MEDHGMSVNIGTIDRLLRIIVGLAVLSLVFVGPKSLWGLVGLIPLATAVFGYCPAYALFGIRTCQIGTAKRV
jgi:hypothetical protein